MPTTPDSLKGLVATSAKGITTLGYICWYSIPDESVSIRNLKKVLVMHGLPPALAPKDTKAINTFKRAMREQEGMHRDGGRTTETAVDLVTETPEDCVYQISRLVRDLDERIIEHPKALRVIFNKYREDISFNPLGGVPRSELVPVMDAITDFYETNGGKVTGAKVRGIVRNYLKDEPDEQRGVEGLQGENLRGRAGGIYFVPARHQDQLTALAEALGELYHGKSYLMAVPMADGATEREIIRRHHLSNTRDEMKEAIADAARLSAPGRDRAARTDSVAHHFAKYRALQRRTELYANLLKDEQEEIQDMSRILGKQLDKLIG